MAELEGGVRSLLKSTRDEAAADRARVDELAKLVEALAADKASQDGKREAEAVREAEMLKALTQELSQRIRMEAAAAEARVGALAEEVVAREAETLKAIATAAEVAEARVAALA